MPEGPAAHLSGVEHKKQYHMPVLSTPDFGLFRGPGPGLGNLLFPIARAVVGREAMGGKIVLPTMRQVKVGPYLRREKDKRTYGELFRPRKRSEWIDWACAVKGKYQDESCNDKLMPVTRYQGMGKQFHDIVGHADLVSNFLRSVSRHRFHAEPYDIAVHIRQGDFAAANISDEKQSTRLPLDWYLEALEAASRFSGSRAPRGVLFTDEDPSFFIEKLGLKNFVPEPSGNALTTIFAMSCAKILIPSRSTFSLWGQYLGKSYAYWPKGFDLGRYKPVDSIHDFFV